MDNSLETAGNLLHCIRNLTQRSMGSSCIYRSLQQVAVISGLSGLGNALQAAAYIIIITLCSQLFQALNLSLTYSSVINSQNLQRILFIQTIFIQADNRLIAGVNLSLTAGCCFLNTHLRQTAGNSLSHTAQSLNLLNMSPSPADNLIGKSLHIIGTAPRINNLAHTGFILNVQLGITRNTGRKISRQGNSLIQGVGMQGLGMSQGGTHSFH